MRPSVRDMCFAAFLSVCGYSAQAENVVKLHAVFLDAPTPWCEVDQGVPVVVTMDGPDVGGTLVEKFFITRRRGNERIRVQIPPPDGYSDTNSVFVGRFMARLEVCEGFWGRSEAIVEWQVVDGETVLDSGNYESRHGIRNPFSLFRKGYGSDDYVFRLPDEKRLVAKGPIEFTHTMEAFASPAQEQSQ